MASSKPDPIAGLAELGPLVLLKALAAALQAQPNFCMHCGANNRPDSVVTRDGFTIDARAGWAMYEDRYLKLTSVQKSMLYTLAYNNRRRSTPTMLADRCCPRGTSIKVVRTHLSSLKRSLKQQGVPVPFRNESKIGYYWSLGS